MGTTQAMDMAQFAREGSISLYGALAYHLQTNHYPPLPLEYAAVLAVVIDGCNSGELEHDSVIPLPAGLKAYPRRTVVSDGVPSVSVADLLESTNSWYFLDEVTE